MSQGNGRTSRQRRALNTIWTAAGDYGFQPEFMAFHRDGSPDLYLNSIVGFVHRHYDAEKLSAYAHSFDDSLLRDLFTDILWLGLEQAAYGRESADRPALSSLRREHARRWLEDDIDLSMQQLMMRSEIVHGLKRGRCREILGEPTGLRNPWDKRLYESLRFSGTMGTEDIIREMQRIWKTFFRFHFTNLQRKRIHFLLGPRFTAFLRKWLPMQREQATGDSLPSHPVLLEGGTQEPGGREGVFGGKNSQARERELEERFGPLLCSRTYMGRMEQEFCRDAHEGVHLWLSAGKGEARPQNLTWYQAHRSQYRTGAARLKEHLKNCLEVYRQPTELSSRYGMLRPSRVWRAEYLKDTRIFSAWEESAYGNISLLLLLDASASREAQQEMIASQAYAIAEGVRQAGLPISVVSFCSMYGYTVLQRMKGFSDGTAEGVFGYSAQGWNRDGLAFRSASELFGDASGKRLMLVLTDAYPSDETDIPSHGMHPSRRYLQEAAVKDTAEAVRELRRQGIKVVGIVNSVFSEGIVENYAKQIYGSNYARIAKIRQIADVVGELLEKEIRGG